MAKTSKYAVNEICINGKTYVHNPLFRVVGTGSSPSNPEDGLLNIDWYEDYKGIDTGNIYAPGDDGPDVNGLRASVTFDIPYRGRVNDVYIAGESDSLYYRGEEVMYLDIPEYTVLDIVYNDRWNVVSLPDIMCIKYDDLRWLAGIGRLIPGMKYRIIDYIPNIIRGRSINGKYYHVDDQKLTQFDIIVTALSNTELSEDAEACLSEQNTAARTYYNKFNVNLGSWKLKYTIDDNPIKYDWATGYVVRNPGEPLYTDNERYWFGNHNNGEYIGYTNGYLIRYENEHPTYTFEFYYDSCFSINVKQGIWTGDGRKSYTINDEEYIVYKSYRYIIDEEVYYASGDLYYNGLYSNGNVFLISESQFNSSIVTVYGIMIEWPYVGEKDGITSITWHPDNRGVVYNMIDDKGNEAPWDFKNICIGQNPTSASIGHFFEKQQVNGKFCDASIEGDMMFNNVIKSVKGNSGRGFEPWILFPYSLYANRFSVIKQQQETSINFDKHPTVHNNIIDNCYNVTIITNGVFNVSSDNHIKNSVNTTIAGRYNHISDVIAGANSIYGTHNTVRGGFTITIGSNSSSSDGNTIGANCNAINIGPWCDYNSIGANCVSITLGSRCRSNSMGAYCRNITLGALCNNNSFGNSCKSCYVRLGSSTASSHANYVENCHWDDGVSYTTVYSSTTSDSNKIKNIHVHRGMNFPNDKFVYVPTNSTCEWTVTRALPSTSNSTIVS